MALASNVLRWFVPLVLLGGVGWWSAWVVRDEVRNRPLRYVAGAMLDGAAYDSQYVERLIAYLNRTEGGRDCTHGGLVEAATIRIYGLGAALAGQEGSGLSELAERARKAVRSALACSPHLGALWFQLFWLETVFDDPTSEQALSYLRMSYKLTPYEGWIFSFRSVRVLSLYEKLPSDLQALARSEFILMARDNPRRAVRAFERQHESTRRLLLPLLAEVPLKPRTEFARRLDSPEVEVPGVVLDDLSKGTMTEP